MLELAGEEVETLSMDHHGLVAAVCKDLKISERIDARLGKGDFAIGPSPVVSEFVLQLWPLFSIKGSLQQ